MKLTIEVELAADELPAATELITQLRYLTERMRIRNREALFLSLVKRLEDARQLNAIVESISTLTADDIEGGAKELADALALVAFDAELIARGGSTVPYMNLLPRLPELLRNRVRDIIIHTVANIISAIVLATPVITFLTIKRSKDANRAEFYAQAEAFAALVSLDVVPISGAVSTLTVLLKKPETQCAAVTMLGKTIEMCFPLLEQCDEQGLAGLRAALRALDNDVFKYDIDYIEDNMGWRAPSQPLPTPSSSSLTTSPPQTAATSSATQHGPFTLQHAASYSGHIDTIFTLAWDEARGQVISGSRDGTLTTWSPDGTALEVTELPSNQYACAMDIAPMHDSLLVCAVRKDDPLAMPPSILRYVAVGRGSFAEAGAMLCDNVRLIPCIKVLGDGAEHLFVTGEVVATASSDSSTKSTEDRLCMYDIGHGMPFSTLTPLRTYTEHKGLIMCVAANPANPNMFLSGSRDCTVRVWDKRVEHCVGVLGKCGGTVTSIDASLAARELTVLTTALDKKVARWDLRALASKSGSVPIASVACDDTPALRVAALAGACDTAAVVSTLKGLHLVDFSSGSSHPTCHTLSDRDSKRVHDVKWASSRGCLYAAGEDKRVDVYAMASLS
eukprot:jgi/Chlat1/3344/Chrsp23S03654